MDPNQERRDSCKMCKRWLPKRKARFCSNVCERRFRSSKTPRNRLRADYLDRVTEEGWIPREEQVEIDKPDGIYRVGETRLALVQGGRVRAVAPKVREGGASVLKMTLPSRQENRARRQTEERIVKREAEREARRWRRDLARGVDPKPSPLGVGAEAPATTGREPSL